MERFSTKADAYFCEGVDGTRSKLKVSDNGESGVAWGQWATLGGVFASGPALVGGDDGTVAVDERQHAARVRTAPLAQHILIHYLTGV